MTPGIVLLYPNFKFPDGSTADKWLVMLGKPKNDKILTVKTTSQQRRRPLQDGCHVNACESVFTFNANPGGFKTTTWVILDPIVLKAAELAARVTSGAVKPLFSLRDTDLRAIQNCLRKCQDVSPEELSLIG